MSKSTKLCNTSYDGYTYFYDWQKLRAGVTARAATNKSVYINVYFFILTLVILHYGKKLGGGG